MIRPIGLPPYIVGVPVVMRSGGPVMKIEGFDHLRGVIFASWQLPDGETGRGEFPRVALQTARSLQKTPR